jgi:predicted alpha-1,2-mannosidase
MNPGRERCQSNFNPMKICPNMNPLKVICVLSGLSSTLALAADFAPVTLVNPLMGTDSTRSFSHGNQYPAIALPFPMNTWAPYTQPEKDSFFYQYSQNRFRGIRETHQPSPWIADYGTFSLMPVSGKLAVTEDARASAFEHGNEIAQPGYYKVHLDTWNATAEVTPTERCARFRFTFEDAKDSFVVLDAFPGGSTVEIIPSENKIIGTTRYNHGGVPNNFSNYFVIVFDQPFTDSGVWSPDSVQQGAKQLAGNHVGAYVKFASKGNGVVTCKVASSFISPEQALRNLEQEIGNADFDTIKKRADDRWNEMLGRARVEGGTLDQQRTFYSSFYRSILFPHKFYEVNTEGEPVYFSPYDGKLHDGFLYTDTGFWDTFRAAHPLYNLLFPEVSAEILQGLLNAYDQSGWLPEWASPGHRDCMIGNHAFSLLADGWFKGIRSFDPQKAVNAMVHDANAEGPMGSVGRSGANFYNRLGYAPYPGIRESGAKTVEYAYDDFCAAKLANAVGRTAEAKVFAQHAMNYTNLFDPSVGFIRGRDTNGNWNQPFYPDEWGGPFTEGCSWHWTWSDMQDVPGLIKLLGGDKAFADKLDAVFTSPNTFRPGTYGGPIHEMTEMAALNMGQYAHGNEPIHHMIYLYDYAGQPWKAQSRARQVMSLLYQATPDGFCGDEDTGQTSAWYVFSAIGFYPVCPGDPSYLMGSPLFDKVTLTLKDGKTFTVTANNNGPQKPYIQSGELNGNSFDKVYLSHDEIMRGGELKLHMGSAPNEKWAVKPEGRPASALLQISQAGESK